MSRQRNLEWYRSLPPMVFASVEEIDELYEYSATNPTDVVLGKIWKRLNGSFDDAFIRAGGIPKWVVCRYEAAPPQLAQRSRHYLSAVAPDDWPSPPDPERGLFWVEMAATVTYRPVVRRKMGRYDGETPRQIHLRATEDRSAA